MADELLDILERSVARLRQLAGQLSADQVRRPAYPTEWSVAQVLSHIGSGAVIMGGRLEAARTGVEVDPQPVWDEWNAMDPEAQAADALEADARFLEQLQDTPPDERSSFTMSMGPMQFDFDGLVRLRLNEHVLHTWDVEVTLDPTATLPDDAAAAVLDSLPMIVAFAGKPTGTARTILVHTKRPQRSLTLSLGEDRVELSPPRGEGSADLTLPAESLVRLVYGRLDADHTPDDVRGELVPELRAVFPGV